MALAILWKPPGIASQKFIGEFKKSLKLAGPSRQGIGHNGTLDPFAEGILCVGIEEGTKLLAPLSALNKSYRVKMSLGLSSDSFDTSSPAVRNFGIEELSLKVQDFDFKKFLESKIGYFQQVPPPQSAVHIDGKRAYEWARMGKVKELPSRRVQLLQAQHLDLSLEKDFWSWSFEVSVSSGTYIRSFARDWGQEITGQSALLSELLRIKMGPWSLDRGQSLKWLSLQDLEGFFSMHKLGDSEACALQKYGRWDPALTVTHEVKAKPRLFLNPQGHPLAWAEANSKRLSRVFLNNPLN